MNHQETLTLFGLAHRLGSTPRRLLLVAARMTDQHEPDTARCLDHIRLCGTHHNVLVDQCARQMLTPVDSYARDSLEPALLALWQDSGQTD